VLYNVITIAKERRLDVASIDKLVEAYRILREKKEQVDAEYKAKLEEIRRRQEIIENKILDFFNQAGVESARTPHGTAYISEVFNAKVVNRDDFYRFVRDNDAWDFVEARANKTAVKQYIEEHNGSLPPGVDVAVIRKVNIRK
jgi:hypothetical protein